VAPKTILVVDDDPGIVKLVETMLQRDGYEVLVAFNGREALRIHAASQPDLILLDLAMPIMNGLEVLRELRQHDGDQRRTPVVFLTAHAQGYFSGRDPDVDDVEGYITKPITLTKLRQEIMPLLD
jgi:CheY-like chemotaxis protein